MGIRHYFRFIYLRFFSLDRWYHILFFIKCDYSLQFELMKLTFNNKITTIEKKNVMYTCRKQFCMEKYQRVSSYYGNLLTYISYCFIKIKILNWIARSKNLQLVGEKWPNLPNKFIYMGMTNRYSVMGIIGLRHEVSIFTGRCSLIAHHRQCLSAGRRFQQPCCIICFKFLILRESMIYYQIART